MSNYAETETTKLPGLAKLKLSADEIAELLSMYARGSTIAECAKEYGICHGTASAYLTRFTAEVGSLKQGIIRSCYDVIFRAHAHLTDDKLSNSTAAQLSKICKDTLQTVQLLTDRDPGKKTPGITKIIREAMAAMQAESTKVIDISDIY